MQPLQPSPTDNAGIHSAARSTWKAIWIAFVWLVALSLIFFAPIILPGPWPHLYIAAGDFSHQFYPFQHYASTRLAQGQLPLWDPFIYGGQPHLADPQTSLFYPVGLAVNLIAGHVNLTYTAMEWRAWLDVALGSIWSALFIGRVSRSTVGGLVGAAAFAFGGYLMSYPLPQLPVLEASIWLPLILYCLERGLVELRAAPGSMWFALAGAAGATLVLAGHGQTALLAGCATAGYVVWRWVALRRNPSLTALQLVLAALVALGLCAPQLLTTLFTLPATNRVALSYKDASGGYNPSDFWELLSPGGFFQRSYYIGVLPLLLAVVSLRRRQSWPWLVLMVLAGLLALGGHGPLYAFLYAHMPLFASFRDQERAAYLVSFSLAVLAGSGTAVILASGTQLRVAQRRFTTLPLVVQVLPALAALALTLLASASLWQTSPPGNNLGFVPDVATRQLVVVALVAAALIAIGCAALGLWHFKLAIAVLVVLPVVNLFGANWQLNQQATNPAPDPAPAAMAVLRQQPGIWRFDSLRSGELPRNVGALVSLPAIGGDDPISLERTLGVLNQPDHYRTWLLFNVGYVVSKNDPGNGFSLVAHTADLSVYRMQYGLPRAWAVRNVIVADAPAAALAQALKVPQLGDTVVLEQPVSGIQGPKLPTDQHEDVFAPTPESLQMTVSVTDNAVLVISEPYAPGWTATVDGEPADLLHADYALMALRLDAGNHAIALSYSPPGLQRGLLAALVAFVLLLASLVIALVSQLRSTPRRV